MTKMSLGHGSWPTYGVIAELQFTLKKVFDYVLILNSLLFIVKNKVKWSWKKGIYKKNNKKIEK